MIEQDFYGLDGEEVTVGVTEGGAVQIIVVDGDSGSSVWLRGRDAFRLAEFLLDVLAQRDRDREAPPA